MGVASVEAWRTDSKLVRVFLLGGLEKIKNYREIKNIVPYLIGGGGGGGGCLAAGGRDEGREPAPGVGERSRMLEG